MKILIMISRRKKVISCVDSRTEKKNYLRNWMENKRKFKDSKNIFVKQSDTTNLWNQINKKKKNLNGKKKSPRKKEMICEIKWGKNYRSRRKINLWDKLNICYFFLVRNQ